MDGSISTSQFVKVKLKPKQILTAILIAISLQSVSGYKQYDYGSAEGYGHHLTADSFNNHFEHYYGSNTYLTDAQKEEYEEYWGCILTGRTEYILKQLKWAAQHGHYDDYFMALNYLVYVHDHHLKSPKLLEIIEDLIDESITQNVIKSSVLLTHSVTYNIVKYLVSRFKPSITEQVQEVPFSIIPYDAPSHSVIQRLIAALGPHQHHGTHTHDYYTIIVNYLKALPPLVYRQLDFTQTPKTCLKHMFAILINQHPSISPNLKSACQYYLQYFKQQDLEYQTQVKNQRIIQELITFVPRFNSTHRDILLKFLHTGSKTLWELCNLIGHPRPSESYLYNLLIRGLSSPKITGELQQSFKFYVNYFQNLNVIQQLSHDLPQFINSPGKEYYQILVRFMNGPDLKHILGTVGINPLNIKSKHVLLDILNLLKTNVHVTTEIQTAVKYYLGYYDILSVKDTYHLGELFGLIPQPTLRTEYEHYHNLKILFESTTLLQIIKQKHLEVIHDRQLLLHQILDLALKSTLTTLECKRAILHYFKFIYNEGLTIEEELKIEFLIEELKAVDINGTHGKQLGVITSFLQSDLCYLVLLDHKIDFTQNTFIVLEEIFETITHLEYLHLDVEIIQVVTWFKTQVHNVYQLEDQVIHKIYSAFTTLQDQVVNSSINQQYEMDLDVFLQCDEMHGIIRHAHFDSSLVQYELLYEVLLVIEEDINVSMEIREGAYHYSRYILEPLLGNVPCDMDELLKLLPQPSNHVTHRYFNTIKSYLQHGVPRFVISQIDFTKTRIDLLLDILQALVYSDRIPVDVRGTARYYWHFFNTNQVVNKELLMNKLDKLTLLLPRPSSIHETQYYNLMVSYLKGKLIMKLLNTISINLHKPDVRILRDVLVLSLNTKLVHMDIKIVCRFYLNMIDNGVIGDVADIIIEHVNVEEVEVATTHETITTDKVIQVAPTAVKVVKVAPKVVQVVKDQNFATASTLGVAVATKTTQATTLTSTTMTSTNLSSEQTAVLQKIQTELNQMTTPDQNQANRDVLTSYLQTPIAYQILQSSGVNLEAPGSNLLADFVEIAAHTNDIPQDLRLASERYEVIIPSLTKKVTVTPHSHLITLDNIFHKIKKTTLQSTNVLIAYNAIDRYLHTEVPSLVLQGTHIDLNTPPLELLQDMLLLSKECVITQEDIDTLQGLIAQSRETFDVVQGPLLDHLYRLHKIFQLIPSATNKDTLNYYYTIDSFLRSNTIYELLQANEVDFNLELRDLLQLVLKLTIDHHHVKLSHDIIESAVYFNNLMFPMDTAKELDVVFHLIDQPEEVEGVAAFDTVKEFIHSPQVQGVMENVNFDVHRNPDDIITNVLDLTSHNTRVTSEVQHAASYLLERIKGMTLTTTQSTAVVQTKQTIYTHNSVHSLQSLSSLVTTTSTTFTSSNYVDLLHILPQIPSLDNDYAIVKTYFEHLNPTTINTLVTNEEIELLQHNEEGLLRLIFLKLVHDAQQPDNVRTACAHFIKQRYYDFSAFVDQLQAPTFEEETTYYNLMKNYLTGDDIYRYFDLAATEYNTNLQTFKVILTKLSLMDEIPTDVKQACVYYVNHNPFFDYGTLAQLLPQATNNNIKKLHATMVRFLTSKELVNKLTSQFDLTKYVDTQDLILKDVLLLAEKCDWLDESIRVAAKYYSSVIKPVAISMRKVLTRTLDLSEIFYDAFDFSAFSKLQFDAYHEFYTYVSERTQELLASKEFEFWTEQNKRGEFTVKFLNALSTREDCPGNILGDIEILKPLVHMDNGGELDV